MALKVGASPGELLRPLLGHQGDLEGPRCGCQPWGLPRTLSGHQGDLEALEVGAYPGELPRPSRRPGGPLRWVLVLENYPRPYQATRETWRALQVSLMV